MGNAPGDEPGVAVPAGRPPRGTPKNYLLAWLLVLLKGSELHGYEIVKTLRDRFDVAADPGTVYRALRGLEHSGCIASWWDEKELGPNRRMYRLTPAGVDALAEWHAAFGRYRRDLDVFFELFGAPRP